MTSSSVAIRALLESFIGAGASDLAAKVAKMVPRPDDYARVFVPDFVEVARSGFEALWRAAPPVPEVPPGATLVLLSATGGELAADTGDAHAFPGGFKHAAHALAPETRWYCWRFVFGDERGRLYSGLTWQGDHAAWFPKPWRVVR